LRPQIVAYAGLARKLASSAENIDVASNFAAGAIYVLLPQIVAYAGLARKLASSVWPEANGQ